MGKVFCHELTSLLVLFWMFFLLSWRHPTVPHRFSLATSILSSYIPAVAALATSNVLFFFRLAFLLFYSHWCLLLLLLSACICGPISERHRHIPSDLYLFPYCSPMLSRWLSISSFLILTRDALETHRLSHVRHSTRPSEQREETKSFFSGHDSHGSFAVSSFDHRTVLILSLSLCLWSGHEMTRRRGVEFSNDQSSAPSRTSGRHMSVVYHSPVHEALSSSVGSSSGETDPNRLSVVNCLAPASVAMVVRWGWMCSLAWNAFLLAWLYPEDERQSRHLLICQEFMY